MEEEKEIIFDNYAFKIESGVPPFKPYVLNVRLSKKKAMEALTRQLNRTFETFETIFPDREKNMDEYNLTKAEVCALVWALEQLKSDKINKKI